MFKQIVIDHIHEILWVCLIMLHVFYLISAPFWAFPGVRNAMIRNMFFLIMKLLDWLGIGIPLERSLGLGSGFGLDSLTLMASCVTPSRRTLGEIRLVNYGWCHSWYDHSHDLTWTKTPQPEDPFGPWLLIHMATRKIGEHIMINHTHTVQTMFKPCPKSIIVELYNYLIKLKWYTHEKRC